MPININNIFNAKSVDLEQLYSKTGSGFFIPIYQRQYTWNTKHIDRMLDDVFSCIHRIKEDENSLTFIGTIITVADKQGVAKDKDGTTELPSEVNQVIDGQQRLTSYLLIMMAYHSILFDVEESYKDDVEADLSKAMRRWVDSKINSLKAVLNNCCAIYSGETGDKGKGYNYYPKLIRAGEDADGDITSDYWSCYEEDAHYTSPFATFNKHFSDHFVSKVKGGEKFVPIGSGDDTVVQNFKHSRKLFESALQSDELFPTHLLASDKILLGRFLNENIELSEDITQNDYDKAAQILRVIMLGNFLFKRVVATHVDVSDDNYAFDMFEALNTTGEPLTAFETFKPKVVEYCRATHGPTGYSRSLEAAQVRTIEKTLNIHSKAEDKHKKTTALLQAFRLAYSGSSLGGHLSEQRLFLNNAFEEAESKLEFVQLLSSTWSFISEIWDSKTPDLLSNIEGLPSAQVLSLASHPKLKQANFCIKALKAANHRIVCGLFSDFYNQFRASQYQYDTLDELISIVLATTRFFVRYRAFTSNTDGIDSMYRQILSSGIRENSVPSRSVDSIKQLFDMKLAEKGRNNKEEWTHVVKTQDLYKNRKDLSKLMLLLSFESSSHDSSKPGHLCDGANSLGTYLDIAVWDEFHTVEHVWPQNPENTKDWCSDLDSALHLHSLGNLSILPPSENSILGNKGWDKKKIVFDILSEPSLDGREAMSQQAHKNGILTANQVAILVQRSKLHPHIDAIAHSVEWNRSYVEARALNLLERVWEQTELWA